MNSQQSALPESIVTQSLQGIYGTASAIDEFMKSHIESLKASDDPTISTTGDLLDKVKTGLMVGYAAPIAVVAVGQMLLGNPFTAIYSAAAMAISPVAITCAAVGAIWMGWNALDAQKQASILEVVREGLGLTVQIMSAIVDNVVLLAKMAFSSPQLAVLKEMVKVEAANFGKRLSDVTNSIWDSLVEKLPGKPPTPQGEDQQLTEVLWGMDREELTKMLGDTLGRKCDFDAMEPPELRRLLTLSLGDAAAYSWPWATRPSYPEIVALVATQMKLPVTRNVSLVDLERAILFKAVELSLERLTEAQKQDLVEKVQSQLSASGVREKVAFEQIFAFVKTGGMDIGGTLGGLVLAAPGMYGVVGLNFLQFAVLKGIILSSGYFAAGAATLGLGTGGLLLAVVGWAGPVGVGLAVLFTAYSIAGPAYRRLVPAVCMIAAKRLELSQIDTPQAVH